MIRINKKDNILYSTVSKQLIRKCTMIGIVSTDLKCTFHGDVFLL